ncbi:MAG TPA: alpha/beta hydrolase-fold protein [Silvibacterium sp.]|nr:alpha/beta hydrolase-fold protein [Silvibacterium sp.]
MQFPEQADRAVESSRLLLHSGFRSRFLPGDRNITVYLPPGYDQNAHRNYPALYLQDGQNLFASRANPEIRTWGFAESADQAIQAGEAEPLLVVGIANAGERRLAEYTPTADWELGGGEADKYGLMLTQEILHFIASSYRVKSGAANTGLGGSSLGALASLYLGLKYSEIFGKLALLSPSVWWNHRAILTMVGNAPRHRIKPRIWLDVGEAEGRRNVVDSDLLERKLRSRGWRPGLDLSYERIPGGSHDEASWAERVKPMLRFLFPA